jgi:hypothetical protein
MLDRDIREDDVEPLMQSIRMLRCVAGVSIDVLDIDALTARARIRMETAEKVRVLLNAVLGIEESK